MVVNNVLKRQIFFEILALLFLVFSICYAFAAINKGQANKVADYKGFVSVLDDTKVKGIQYLSNGEGLNQEGITYTVTNNNKQNETYKVVIEPSLRDDKILSKVRIGIDDLYVYELSDLEKIGNGYVIITNNLEAGYTKVHNIKIWFSDEVPENNLTFDYTLVR